MKNVILSLLFLLVWNVNFSQELSSDKKYNFAELFEQVRNETPVFMVTFSKENKILLFYKSQIVFPLVEEKEMMNFSKGNRQREFKPTIISFGNFHQRKSSFTIHSSYKQQAQGGQLKILKGYDYCLRPIY